MKAGKADSKSQIAFLQAMLNRFRADNPKVKLLIEREINSIYGLDHQGDVQREVTRRLKIQNRKLLERLASLRDQLKLTKAGSKKLKGQLDELMKLNKSLAQAVGSCSNCWGEDPDCITCSGDGAPGWRSINRRLFNIYILPALENKYGLDSRIKRVAGHD